MRLKFSTKERPPKGRKVFDQKLERKHASPRKPGERRGKLRISKISRLVTIEFACRLDHAGLHDCEIDLTEGEIMMLASLCRRDRDDAAFLRAIADAGLGLTEIRQTRRTARNAAGDTARPEPSEEDPDPTV